MMRGVGISEESKRRRMHVWNFTWIFLYLYNNTEYMHTDRGMQANSQKGNNYSRIENRESKESKKT